jgi:hypothetical protein
MKYLIAFFFLSRFEFLANSLGNLQGPTDLMPLQARFEQQCQHILTAVQQAIETGDTLEASLRSLKQHVVGNEARKRQLVKLGIYATLISVLDSPIASHEAHADALIIIDSLAGSSATTYECTVRCFVDI